jgi:ABC-type amino acid transport system permease subunit
MRKDRAFSLIKFAPDKNLAIALGVAVLSVMASALINLTEEKILRIILRQLVQFIGISLVFPFFILHYNREFQKASIHLDPPLRYIAISILLAVI